MQDITSLTKDIPFLNLPKKKLFFDFSLELQELI